MTKYMQLPLLKTESADLPPASHAINEWGNRLAPEDQIFHDWYRFVLSYPAHLVSYDIVHFGLKKD